MSRRVLIHEQIKKLYPNYMIQSSKEFKDRYEILLLPLDDVLPLPVVVVFDNFGILQEG